MVRPHCTSKVLLDHNLIKMCKLHSVTIDCHSLQNTGTHCRLHGDYNVHIVGRTAVTLHHQSVH